jgi:hypothetical protein
MSITVTPAPMAMALIMVNVSLAKIHIAQNAPQIKTNAHIASMDLDSTLQTHALLAITLVLIVKLLIIQYVTIAKMDTS